MGVRQAVGRYGERVAATFLETQGLRVLDRNWRCRQGEIDIIALEAGCVVFCEVKTRRSDTCGAPVEAVTVPKQLRIRRLAAIWLAAQVVSFPEIRIDVVAITLPRRGAAQVTHFRGVG